MLSNTRFLGLWEHSLKPEFNYLEFEAFERETGSNNFALTPKRWVEPELMYELFDAVADSIEKNQTMIARLCRSCFSRTTPINCFKDIRSPR